MMVKPIPATPKPDKDEPSLRPESVEKIRKIEKQKSIRVDDFRKRYSLKKR